MGILNRATDYLYCFYRWYSTDFMTGYLNLISLGTNTYRNFTIYIADEKDPEAKIGDYLYLLLTGLDEDEFLIKSLILRTDKNFVSYRNTEKGFLLKLKTPKDFKHIVLKFFKGEFSKMYSSSEIEKLFSKSKRYLIKYNDKILKESEVDEIENISSNDKIRLSVYNVLSKSNDLRLLLNKLYMVEIPEEQELDTIDRTNDIFKD